jgi:putative exosortase-associated protein (TIGR04073 family)
MINKPHLRIKLFLLALLVSGFWSAARANPSVEPGMATGVEEAVDQMSRKFWRGVVNVVTGVGELPRQLILSCRENGPVVGVPVGFLNGVLLAPVRIGVGAFEAGTFVVPLMPDNHTPSRMTYAPLMTPVFVWQSE